FPPRRHDRRDEAGGVLGEQGAHGVLEHGELAEEGVLLERPAQAKDGEVPGGKIGHPRAIEEHLAVMRQPVCDGGDAAALARSVRPDDAEDASGFDLPRHPVQRDEGAVADAEALDPQDGRRRHSSYLMTSSFMALPSTTRKRVWRDCIWPFGAKVASPKRVPL